MPSKSTKSTSDKKTKSKKSENGSLGVIYSGLFKPRACKLFWHDTEDPEDMLTDEKKLYGKYMRASYINCEDVEKIFGKVAKKYNDQNEIGDLYCANSGSIFKTIKEESGVEGIRAKHFGDQKPKTTKKDSKNAESGEETEDEKPKKVQKKTSKSSKKEESEEDSESEEESEAEEESESENEAPKKVKKGSKSAKPSKTTLKKEPKKPSKTK
jgi:hypothetical protein